MNSIQKQKNLAARRIILPLLTFLCVVFIISNSSQNGEISSVIGENTTEQINGMLGNVGMSLAVPFVRKLGHLAEFALLGIFLMLTLRAYTKQRGRAIAWPLFTGLAVAVTDELYQGLVPGRTSETTDVAIDFVGLLIGLILAQAGAVIVKKIRARKTVEKS